MIKIFKRQNSKKNFPYKKGSILEKLGVALIGLGIGSLNLLALDLSNPLTSDLLASNLTPNSNQHISNVLSYTPNGSAKSEIEEKVRKEEFYCLLLQVYFKCYKDGKKVDIIGNKPACLKLGTKWEKEMEKELKGIAKTTQQQKTVKKISLLFGAVCYAGCMKVGNIGKKLNTLCHSSKNLITNH